MSTVAVERSEVRFGKTTIGYRIVRSPRRSTVSIAIDPAEGVLVTAPRPAQINRLDGIVHAKAPWILRKLREESARPLPPLAHEFVSGETFRYLGRQYRLRVDPDEAPRPLRLENGWLRVPVPRHLPAEHRVAFVRAALVDWYKRRAAERLPGRVAAWAGRMGLGVPRVELVEPRKRWGSATASGVVRLNWRVVQATQALQDYVVAHELAHLRHANHTRDFWATLERAMPDCQQRKAKLAAIGRSLEW
jgi:predicted metal-dependent hydrolase